MARSGASSSATTLHAKVWVERRGGIALTDASADLLEQIQIKGSLSEAARVLQFSYRHAWKLLDTANRLWDEPLVITTVGGKRGGGAQLTELGERVLRSFRDLQLRMEAAIEQEIESFRRATRIR